MVDELLDSTPGSEVVEVEVDEIVVDITPVGVGILQAARDKEGVASLGTVWSSTHEVVYIRQLGEMIQSGLWDSMGNNQVCSVVLAICQPLPVTIDRASLQSCVHYYPTSQVPLSCIRKSPCKCSLI